LTRAQTLLFVSFCENGILVPSLLVLSICCGLPLSRGDFPGGLRPWGSCGQSGCKNRAGEGTLFPRTGRARGRLCLPGRGPSSSGRCGRRRNRCGRRRRRQVSSRGSRRSGLLRRKKAGAPALWRHCAGLRSSRRGLGRSLHSGGPRSHGRAPHSRLGRRSLSTGSRPGHWRGRNRGSTPTV
uniref:Uncharacterized protein n=1 Tax=Mustela putorius furo TaxID=9669 RepID=M3YG92_MUSPF